MKTAAHVGPWDPVQLGLSDTFQDPGRLWGDQMGHHQNLLKDHAPSPSIYRLGETSIHGNNQGTLRKIIWGFSMSSDCSERKGPIEVAATRSAWSTIPTENHLKHTYAWQHFNHHVYNSINTLSTKKAPKNRPMASSPLKNFNCHFK